MFPLYVPNDHKICNFFAEGKTPFMKAQQLYYCNLAMDAPTNPVTPSMIRKELQKTGADRNNPLSQQKYERYARSHQFLGDAYASNACYSCTDDCDM